MGIPGEGISALWRNRLGDVAQFLNQRHGSKYLILNLSEDGYTDIKFAGKVEYYGTHSSNYTHYMIQAGRITTHPLWCYSNKSPNEWANGCKWIPKMLWWFIVRLVEGELDWLFRVTCFQVRMIFPQPDENISRNI